MPIIDMPLEQLKVYQGRNPCPPDMDAYWDRALAEMHAVDPKVELKPAAFKVPGAECFDLYFTGVRGARVHAKYLRPSGTARSRHPAVVQFHGYAGNAGDWAEKLRWVAMGFSIAALDCRGQAGASQDVGEVSGYTFKGHIIRGLQDAPDKLLFRDIYLDNGATRRPDDDHAGSGPARVGAFGGSQGGGLTVACASLEPRVKRVAPVFPFLCDYLRVWEMDLAKDAYDEIRTFLRLYDPRHERKDEIFTTLGYVDVQHLARRIKGES